MGHRISTLDDLGTGSGLRKVRAALGVTAFGVNAIVFPVGAGGPWHFHETQDELYFVHRGTLRVEVDGDVHELGPGGLAHVESTTPRRISNAGEDELVVLAIGGKDGYVERDGKRPDPSDVPGASGSAT